LIPIFIVDRIIDVTGHPFGAVLFFVVVPIVWAIGRRLIRSAPIPGQRGTDPAT
jgi:hypothetical protein